MAVRIYALAKELKVDSKELVDICTKAGVPGKGSALASLTEDEVEKVQQFLKGGGTAKAKADEAAPAAPQRPTEPARSGKMPVIVTPKPSLLPARPKRDEPRRRTGAGRERRSQRVLRRSETAVAVETSRRPGPLAGAMGREKYIGPGNGQRQSSGGWRRRRAAERKKADGGGTDRADTAGGETRADAEDPSAKSRSQRRQ